MAASVQIVGYYAGVKTVVTTQRFSTTDQADSGLSYPNNIPPEGETYRSYWIYTGLEITGGTFSQITYLRFVPPGDYNGDWDMGDGYVQIALKDEGDHGIPVESIVAAAGVEGSYGYDIKDATHGVAFYKDETTPCADVDDYGPATPFVFDNTVYTKAGVTKLICWQAVWKPNSTFGAKDTLSNYLRWREI